MPVFPEDLAKEPSDEVRQLKGIILDVLSSVKDPEIGMDVVNLGLIYGIDVDANKGIARVKMTLTTPTCPYAGMLLAEIEKALSAIEELEEIHVDLVWEPPWKPEFMSELAKKKLGYYGRDNI